MQVALLLALIWAAVLLPPAIRAHARRRAEFVGSFDRPAPVVLGAAGRPRTPAVSRAERRRHILAGLLVAMAATLVAGLLPPLRVLLVVHLFLVDSFLAYVAVLVHLRRRDDAAAAPARRPARPRRNPLARRAISDRRPLLAGAWPD